MYLFSFSLDSGKGKVYTLAVLLRMEVELRSCGID
jgi:hypothetical protein